MLFVSQPDRTLITVVLLKFPTISVKTASMVQNLSCSVDCGREAARRCLGAAVDGDYSLFVCYRF